MTGVRSVSLAEGLGLAAAPTFAVMALLTHVFDRGAMAMMMCGGGGFPLGGMVPMYLLMSGFHLGPWLRLLARGGGGGGAQAPGG